MFNKFHDHADKRHISSLDKLTKEDASSETNNPAWMQPKIPTFEPTLSANQRTSLSALIVYVAHKNGENEFGVERQLADHFNIPNIMCLPAIQYDSAIRFLVDGIGFKN